MRDRNSHFALTTGFGHERPTPEVTKFCWKDEEYFWGFGAFGGFFGMLRLLWSDGGFLGVVGVSLGFLWGDGGFLKVMEVLWEL